MVSCEQCDGESFSKRDRQKASTCDDCIVDNQIVEHEYTIDPCDCHAVGHDRSKLKKIEPLLESLYNAMKKSAVIVREEKNFTLYKIKELQKLRDETSSKDEIEEYDKQLKKLGEIKILEDDE